MSWSPDFVAGLSATSITVTYRLRIWKPTANAAGESVHIFSDIGDLRIGASGVQIRGTAVIPSRWSVSFGGFDLELVGDLRPYKDKIKRGALAIIEAKILGFSDFETIGLGQLNQISGFRGVYRATFKDILSAFQSRIDTRYSTTLNYARLFFTAGVSTTVTSNWTAGTTTLHVADASIFEKQSLIDGVVFVTPSSGSDPFYMRWSSVDTVAKTITLTSGTAGHPSTASASNLAVGDLVQNCVRILTNPYLILGMIVTSTGTGTNGVDDDLPANWTTGAAVPAAMVDRNDADAQRAYLKPSTGTLYRWDYVRKEPLSNGLRDLITTASATGQWPVFRQDSFSWRGCTDPTGQFGQLPPIADRIYDSDIIAIEGHIMQDPSLQATFPSTKIIYDLSGNSKIRTNTVSSTLPTQGQIVRDVGALYDHSFGNSDKMAEGDMSRMRVWDVYHWSRLTLRVSLRFATLVAGDVVRITSKYLYDMSTPPNQTYVDKSGMIISTEYDISGRFCVIVVAIPNN